MRNEPGKRYFKNLVSLPGIWLFLLGSVHKQRSFIKKELEKELLFFRESNDGSLTPRDFKKITSYYGLGVPGVLGEVIGVLHGRSMAVNERFCLSFLGGISGLLDDLFDDPQKQEAHLEDFILHPEKMAPQNSYEALLLHLYQKGLSYSEDPGQLRIHALEVYHSQQQSRIQLIPDEPSEVLKNISYSKGGNSFIFYRSCFNTPADSPERELFFHLGGLMQLGNDIFDVWEDHHAKIHTPATRCTKIRDLRELFLQEMNISTALAHRTSYPKKQVAQFLRLTNLALSRVFVCLDQFEKLQISAGHKFCIAQFDRKQLICDMQKPVNQFKAMDHYLRLSIK